jgi:hypothetical protein
VNFNFFILLGISFGIPNYFVMFVLLFVSLAAQVGTLSTGSSDDFALPTSWTSDSVLVPLMFTLCFDSPLSLRYSGALRLRVLGTSRALDFAFASLGLL